MWRVWSEVLADCCSETENSLRTDWSWTWENKKVGQSWTKYKTINNYLLTTRWPGDHIYQSRAGRTLIGPDLFRYCPLVGGSLLCWCPVLCHSITSQGK